MAQGIVGRLAVVLLIVSLGQGAVLWSQEQDADGPKDSSESSEGTSWQKNFSEDLRRSQKIKFDKAKDHWQQDNNIKAAIRELKEYLELYPKGQHLSQVYTMLGKLYILRRQYSRAIEIFERFYDSYPRRREAAAAKLKACSLYSQSGQLQKARSCLEIIVQGYARFPGLVRKAKRELSLLEATEGREAKSKQPAQSAHGRQMPQNNNQREPASDQAKENKNGNTTQENTTKETEKRQKSQEGDRGQGPQQKQRESTKGGFATENNKKEDANDESSTESAPKGRKGLNLPTKGLGP